MNSLGGAQGAWLCLFGGVHVFGETKGAMRKMTRQCGPGVLMDEKTYRSLSLSVERRRLKSGKL